MTGVLAHASAAFLPDALRQPLAAATKAIRAAAGRMVVSLGTESTDLYIVLEGRVQVVLFSSGGREIILRELGPSSMFGELAAIDGEHRSASIVALEDCLLASIPGSVFRAQACASPEAALWLACRLVRQVRDLSERVFELNALRVPNRLHCELLRLVHADDAIDGVIDPFPTHANLAARIGTHREAVTREIGFLAGQGIVRAIDRRRAAVDVARLGALVAKATGEV